MEQIKILDNYFCQECKIKELDGKTIFMARDYQVEMPHDQTPREITDNNTGLTEL